MKIRIKGNSLRYRLTQSEVVKLAKESRLEEQTMFSCNTLIYAIQLVDNDALTADYKENKIVLNMPKSMIDELRRTDKVGFEDHNGPVSLLVEKDFVCIDNTEEDQSDHYPNPNLSC